jgi:MFS family permease
VAFVPQGFVAMMVPTGAADSPKRYERGRALVWRPSVDRSTVAYVILLLLAGIDSAGYSVIGPVLPGLARTTRASPLVAGIMVAGFPVGMLFGFAAAGDGVRRWGSRATLLGARAVLIAAKLYAGRRTFPLDR